MRHTPMGNWSLMRLGYSYRWTRALSRCDATAASQFVVATGPRDIRSSVAVAYRGDGSVGPLACASTTSPLPRRLTWHLPWPACGPQSI